MFNEDTWKKYWDIIFPDFFFFELIKWVSEKNMTDKEKDSYPSYVTTGWYLRCYEYKQAFKKSYENTTEEDRDKVKDLPNFDADIFYEISWIMVDEEITKTITIDWKDIKISEKSFEELKKQLTK